MSAYDHEKNQLRDDLDDERRYRERNARIQQSQLEGTYRDHEAEIEGITEEHDARVAELEAQLAALPTEAEVCEAVGWVMMHANQQLREQVQCAIASAFTTKREGATT